MGLKTELISPMANLEAARIKKESRNATPPMVRAAAAMKALIVHFLFHLSVFAPKKSPPNAKGMV